VGLPSQSTDAGVNIVDIIKHAQIELRSTQAAVWDRNSARDLPVGFPGPKSWLPLTTPVPSRFAPHMPGFNVSKCLPRLAQPRSSFSPGPVPISALATDAQGKD
jgi:hypothetical protein